MTPEEARALLALHEAAVLSARSVRCQFRSAAHEPLDAELEGDLDAQTATIWLDRHDGHPLERSVSVFAPSQGWSVGIGER